MALDTLLLNLFTLEAFIKFLGYVVFITELIYIVYALVVARQINLLNRGFKTPFALLFVFLGFTHLFLAIAVAVFSFSLLI